MHAVGGKKVLEERVDSDYAIGVKRIELMNAVRKGNSEAVKILLDHGADDTHINYYGLINIATKNNNFEIVKLLLEHCADVNSGSKYEKMPLVVATDEGNLEIVRLLINHGVDVNSKGENDCTPLFSAAQNGYLEIVRLLIDKGADVNSRQKDGCTSLFVAAANKNTEILKLLIDKGAYINSRDQLDRSPLCMAFPYLRNVRLLLNHDADANFSLTAALVFSRPYYLHNNCIELLTKKALVQNPEAKKPDFANRKEWSNYWDQCLTEMNKMTKQKIGHSTITFYKFLVSDEHQLATWLRNEDVRQEINDGNYEKKFPIYASEIKTQYDKGSNRKALLDAGNVIVARFPSWPVGQLPGAEVSLHILPYLKNPDLQNLKRSGDIFTCDII